MEEALPFGKESRKALGMLHCNQFEGMKGHMGRDLIVYLTQRRSGSLSGSEC